MIAYTYLAHVDTLHERCREEYRALKAIDDDDNIMEEAQEEPKKKKDNIIAEYQTMQEGDELEYKEGSTSALMKRARKELTMRACFIPFNSGIL